MYVIGTVVFDNWLIKRKIGEGSFGQVFEIQREDFGHVYSAALKVITVPQNDAEFRNVIEEGMTTAQAEQYFYSVVEDIVREFAIMSKLKGTANVVSYEDHKVVRHSDGIGWDILIRMELLNPLLPYAYQNPFSRRDIIKLGIDMCKALELCQRYNIIHRDIKPENIFVSDNGDFKLGDFGIARTVEKTTSGLSKKGTYNYMAPEVYRGETYGFDVDIYSLGIVLYRLLNKNRTPFLPPAPEAITYNKREEALTRRVSGEAIPSPFYAKGRLSEIILKACAFSPKDRYSSPMLMRQELESILYSLEESELIYPDGDELALVENEYAQKTPVKVIADEEENTGEIDHTQSVFSGKTDVLSVSNAEKTESIFHSQDKVELDNDKTESVFRKPNTKGQPKKPVKQKKTEYESNKKKKTITWVSIFVLAIGIVGSSIFYVQMKNKKEAEKLAEYEQLMQRGTQYCESDPEQALSMFLAAQELYPDESSSYTSYAYALYCSGNFDRCITYIEDELALGKNYDVGVQNKLSEILGAAYFEKDEYAAAASFFRLSTAGGDISVSAMRDYAVSLGRLGDVEAANDVLTKMFDAGAQNDITTYVQAEVDYALENYIEAEQGFQNVLNETQDDVLQKRSLRSLAEVYRDCASLNRTSESPISNPAIKATVLLSDGIVKYGLGYDSTLWEMLAMTYFEAYHTEELVDDKCLIKAADCFNRVIELGITKDYLYSNLYTIYYELKNYDSAEEALISYEKMFPNDYMPHALRGMMLITIENDKQQENRDYSKAVSEYEVAGDMIRSDDDRTYYLQLESLIEQLREKGWI